jgi:glutamate racemase
MTVSPDRPIGIFDSGIGGLTVAHAIKKLLPNEQLIYFGDTAHLPYGDKSEAAIQAYSVRIADVLVKKGCKVIVIACNSASSAAYELLKEYVRGIKIINVIDPMIQWVVSNFQNTTVGLIGTKRTVQSGVYLRKISEANQGITLHQLPTPLLAPMIEEGFFSNQISHEIIAQYLSAPDLSGITALILACTHYPLIREEIAGYYAGKPVTILDSSEVVALAVKNYLTSSNLLNDQSNHPDQFLVSDYTESFEASTRLFFGELVHLQEHPLWH